MVPGSRLGPYEIVAPLGAGGMGEVWRARDERLGRDVAIKVLPAELASDPERVKRFEKEARATGTLNHPNILSIHDVGVHEGSPYLVEELLEGQTLRALLNGGPLPVRRAVEVAVQVARGLAAAHGKGIVHRDLKPENLFVTSEGHVKILDFGLAKLTEVTLTAGDEGETETLARSTELGVVLGTVGYMAPEQVRGLGADHRADIFAFGCVLYEMLSGRRAFKGPTPADTMSAILMKDPEPVAGSGNDIPEALQGIVSRCLEKRPEDRFSSAHDLALALQAASGMAAVTTPGRATLAPPRRWLWFSAAALGTLAVAAAAVSVLVVRGRAEAPLARRVITSVAVLPLANLSGDPAQEYFADGMTEELTATLSQISALKVISRTSAMQFKGSTKSLREIAAALGVEGVIEGSVLWSGERVRVTAQLINATTDMHVWAGSYERDLKDVLALQDEVARAVAREVRAKLTPQERRRLTSSRPVNPDAYRLFLEGRLLSVSGGEGELTKAVERFQRAVDLDPTYAPAHAGLAFCYCRAGSLGSQPPYEAFPKAKAAAREALELDEGLAEAHAVLGTVMLMADWDWAGAERELQRALALDPNSSEAHALLGFYQVWVGGRPDLAVTEYGQALDLDPRTSARTFAVGFALYYARRHDESIVQFRKALELDPTGFVGEANMFLGLNYARKQMYDEAIAACETAATNAPEDQLVLGYCGGVFGLAGRPQQGLALLNRLTSLSARHYLDPYYAAVGWDGLGDSDRTMEWLERAYTERSASVSGVRGEFWSDRLRSDPRFQDLVRRMYYPVSTGQ